MADSSSPEVYRVREGFAVPSPDGFPRAYQVGALIAGDDPLAKSHSHLLELAATKVEKATAGPDERRRLRLPSGVGLLQATEPHYGDRNTRGGTQMVHALPPEDENSPASPFASVQPGAGVVADDVPAEQNPAGGPKASEVTVEQVVELTPDRPPGTEPNETELAINPDNEPGGGGAAARGAAATGDSDSGGPADGEPPAPKAAAKKAAAAKKQS